MGDRGRQSSKDLAARPDQPLVTIQRPEPPADLTPEQAAEWRAVVGRLPADWFPRETWQLLAQYCRHVVAANRIAQLIQQMEQGLSAMVLNATNPTDDEDDDCAGFNLKSYKSLLAMQELESRAITALARSMRMTQQATFDKERKKGKVGKKPWEM